MKREREQQKTKKEVEEFEDVKWKVVVVGQWWWWWWTQLEQHPFSGRFQSAGFCRPLPWSQKHILALVPVLVLVLVAPVMAFPQPPEKPLPGDRF